MWLIHCTQQPCMAEVYLRAQPSCNDPFYFRSVGRRKKALCYSRALVTDYVILNHDQVTWTTPELAPTSPNYPSTPTGGRFSFRQI
ncbi:hypothetical protein TNCV_1539471 [Trichonephila clavipes]|nr:hypothetical protein TNCV_1539471 [Trichonephila clavipes]